MAKTITKKSAKEFMERLNKASISPKEKLKLLKEMNSFVKKMDAKVKKLVIKVKKAA